MTRDDNANRESLFRAIVDESRDRIGRLARVYAGPSAEDLVQEILMQVWRALPDYDSRAKRSTWCFRIALNTALSWKRDTRRKKRMPPEHRHGTDALVGQRYFSDEVALLERFLSTLTEVDRAILLMYLEDLTSEETAEAMGMTSGAIRTRLSRIRVRLRDWEANDGT